MSQGERLKMKGPVSDAGFSLDEKMEAMQIYQTMKQSGEEEGLSPIEAMAFGIMGVMTFAHDLTLVRLGIAVPKATTIIENEPTPTIN